MGNLSQKTRLTSIALGLLTLLVVFLASGCDILLPPAPLPPTATPTQTLTPTATIDWFPATPTPTLIPQPSATPQPTLAGRPAGVTTLLVADDFTNEALWSTPRTESGNVAFGNQNLTLAVARQSAYLFSFSQHVLPANAYLETTIQTSLCQPGDQYGLVFWRQSEGDYYRLLFTCDGQYRLELVQGGASIVVHNWEGASRMTPGAPAENRIGLWLNKGQLQLYINNAFQFEEGVARNRSGDLGVFARTISSAAMTVRFSDLMVYQVSGD